MPTNQFPHGHNIADHPGGTPLVEDIQTTSVLFEQFSDANYLRIFWLLCHCAVCGTKLAAMVDMTPPDVAHYLRLLRSDHLLMSRREGKEVYYRAADSIRAQELHHMIGQMMAISCPHAKKGSVHE